MRQYGCEEVRSMGFNAYSHSKFESRLVADCGLVRLFLVRWDVPAFSARLPVSSEVRS